VQNLTALALTSPEKSVTVQTHTHIVTDISHFADRHVWLQMKVDVRNKIQIFISGVSNSDVVC